MGLFNFWRSRASGGALGSFVGGQTAAEQRVNAETVMRVSAAYACARLIAQTIACLSFTMMRRKGEGWEDHNDHPLADLFRFAPNADQSPIEYLESMILQLALRGNHFALKLKGAGGVVVGLEPLPAFPATYVKRLESGRRRFIVTTGQRQGEYDEDEIFFVRGFGDDMDCGLSVISLARETFGRSLAMDRHAGRTMARGVRPNVVLTTEGVLTEDQRQQVQENIAKPFTGSDSAGGMMVLEAGFKVQPITLSPADAQLLEQMKFGAEEVCRWFGVPPFMVGLTEKSTSWGSGLEQQLTGFVKFCLLPYVVRIQQAMKRQLIAPGDRRDLRPTFNLDALMQGDTKTRGWFLSTLTRSGIMTANEARAKENLPPLEGGNELRVQQQMVPLNSEGEGDE